MSDFPCLDLEALQHLEETAVKAAGVDVKDRVVIVEHPDKRMMMLIDKNGDYSQINRSQPQRNHKLLSCSEVVLYSRLMKAESPFVWIGGTGIIVTHDAQRILGHKADYRFQRTAEFKYVQEALGKEPLSQKEFLALLRVRLARSFENDDTRLSLVRSVRSIRNVTDQKIGQGSGSFEAGLTSTANEKIYWPESFTLSLSVFDDTSIDTPQKVECVLDVDPSNTSKPFTITPITADLTKALQTIVTLAGEVISAELAKDAIPVILGEPNAA